MPFKEIYRTLLSLFHGPVKVFFICPEEIRRKMNFVKREHMRKIKRRYNRANSLYQKCTAWMTLLNFAVEKIGNIGRVFSLTGMLILIHYAVIPYGHCEISISIIALEPLQYSVVRSPRYIRNEPMTAASNL